MGRCGAISVAPKSPEERDRFSSGRGAARVPFCRNQSKERLTGERVCLTADFGATKRQEADRGKELLNWRFWAKRLKNVLKTS